MITTIEDGLLWTKGSDGVYCSGWPHTGLRIRRTDDFRAWSFQVWHPNEVRYVEVHWSRNFGEVKRAAEIWMVTH